MRAQQQLLDLQHSANAAHSTLHAMLGCSSSPSRRGNEFGLLGVLLFVCISGAAQSTCFSVSVVSRIVSCVQAHRTSLELLRLRGIRRCSCVSTRSWEFSLPCANHEFSLRYQQFWFFCFLFFLKRQNWDGSIIISWVVMKCCQLAHCVQCMCSSTVNVHGVISVLDKEILSAWLWLQRYCPSQTVAQLSSAVWKGTQPTGLKCSCVTNTTYAISLNTYRLCSFCPVAQWACFCSGFVVTLTFSKLNLLENLIYTWLCDVKIREKLFFVTFVHKLVLIFYLHCSKLIILTYSIWCKVFTIRSLSYVVCRTHSTPFIRDQLCLGSILAWVFTHWETANWFVWWLLGHVCSDVFAGMFI